MKGIIKVRHVEEIKMSFMLEEAKEAIYLAGRYMEKGYEIKKYKIPNENDLGPNGYVILGKSQEVNHKKKEEE